jgi:hypothetical protein
MSNVWSFPEVRASVFNSHSCSPTSKYSMLVQGSWHPVLFIATFCSAKLRSLYIFRCFIICSNGLQFLLLFLSMIPLWLATNCSPNAHPDTISEAVVFAFLTWSVKFLSALFIYFYPKKCTPFFLHDPRSTPSGRKVTGPERKKRKNAINSGHFVPLQRPKAVHALRSDQCFYLRKIERVKCYHEGLSCTRQCRV